MNDVRLNDALPNMYNCRAHCVCVCRIISFWWYLFAMAGEQSSMRSHSYNYSAWISGQSKWFPVIKSRELSKKELMSNRVQCAKLKNEMQSLPHPHHLRSFTIWSVCTLDSLNLRQCCVCLCFLNFVEILLFEAFTMHSRHLEKGWEPFRSIRIL